jgi:SAM-dependent methyltransferase
MSAELNLRPAIDPGAWLRALGLSAEEEIYAVTHGRRYRRMLEAVASALNKSPAAETLLDIAPHLSTEILRAAFPSVRLNTIGGPYRWRHALPNGEHLDFDLNTSHHQHAWPGFHQHDVVFMGEILEHLHASPRMVLGCVRRWIKPGGLLVLQTPNAARLWARFALLRGINPVEPPREGGDQGHFHEFTRQELIDLAAGLDFEVLSICCANDYSPPDVSAWRLFMRRWLAAPHSSLREAFTMVWQKRAHVREPSLRSARLLLHLDRMEVSDGYVRIAGWSADAISRCAATRLVLRTARGEVPLLLKPMDRPDVAAVQGGRVPSSAGFVAELRLASAGDLKGARIAAYDDFGDQLEQPLPQG